MTNRARRRTGAGVAIAVMTITMSNLAAVAINVATSAKVRWPGALDLIRQDPFWWAGVLTALAVFTGALLWWWENRAGRAAEPALLSAPGSAGISAFSMDPAERRRCLAEALGAAQVGLHNTAMVFGPARQALGRALDGSNSTYAGAAELAAGRADEKVRDCIETTGAAGRMVQAAVEELNRSAPPPASMRVSRTPADAWAEATRGLAVRDSQAASFLPDGCVGQVGRAVYTFVTDMYLVGAWIGVAASLLERARGVIAGDPAARRDLAAVDSLLNSALDDLSSCADEVGTAIRQARRYLSPLVDGAALWGGSRPSHS